jgi:hypothetical protein
MSRPLWLLVVLGLSFLLVAGCSYQPARLKSEPLIEIDDRDDRRGSEFCPPGQAKKGNC